MYSPRQPFMTITVKGTFRLVDGGPCVPLPLQEQPRLTGRTNYVDEHGNSWHTPRDEVPFKQKGECLLIGSAHAPGATPVEALEVGLSIGPISKSLSVFGNRNWVRAADGSAELTDPEPFTEMPIRAEYAHGGVDSRFNEHGIGFAPLGAAPGDSVPAANIMPKGQGGVSWERDGRWAGFGMLAPNMLPRRELLGTYDRVWETRRRPMPPEDFDPHYFNAAPEDQRLDGYWTGDEPILLRNLHPDKPAFRSALPGTVVRCFVHHRPDAKYPGEQEFAEVATVLDTCIVDVPEETLTLLWRGTVQIHNRFHGNIDYLLTVEEPVGEQKPANVYADMLRDKLTDKTDEAAKAAEEQLNKDLAALDKEGLTAIISVLKESGAQEELIAEFEKLETMDEAQEVIVREMEKVKKALDDAIGG